jgi:hypothetical protein
MLPRRDKCREKIQCTEETDMKRRIASALRSNGVVILGKCLTNYLGSSSAFPWVQTDLSTMSGPHMIRKNRHRDSFDPVGGEAMTKNWND